MFRGTGKFCLFHFLPGELSEGSGARSNFGGRVAEMDEIEAEKSDTGGGGFAHTWSPGQVWFREMIPAALPWGQEELLEEVPESAKHQYGAKMGEGVKLDGERYEAGQILVVDSERDFQRLLPGLRGASDFIFPWYPKLVPASLISPHQVRIDLADYRRAAGARFRRAFLITLALIALAYYQREFLMIALLGATIYGLHPMVESGMAWMRRVDLFSVEELNRRSVNFEFFRRWVLSRSTTLLKVSLGVLILVFVAQFYTGLDHSIEAAALMKKRVTENGEWWRLVTTGLMHGSVLHIVFNGMALYSLGRVIVALVSQTLLSFVFLVTVVTGSLASIYFGSEIPSVGASGGILGCLGFLLIVTWRFKEELPGYLRANLIQSTFVVGIFGLLGNQFIDNAAHAGGLVGGLALGLIFYPWMRLAPTSSSVFLKAISWVSTGVLLAGVMKIMVELWR